MSAGKLILKQPWDTNYTYQLEWPKFGTLTTPNAGKGVEQQELSFIVGGMQNDTATFLKKINLFIYLFLAVLLCAGFL